MHQVSDDFVSCWRSAITHLETRGREAIKWLKSDLIPPFLDHASFRIGNQLFFVRIEDKDNELDTPSNPDGLKMITDCSYCNEPLQEEEKEFYNSSVDAMPLCTNCGIKLW